MKKVLHYHPQKSRPFVFREKLPLIMFILAIFLSWAPFYVSIAETINPGPYPIKWMRRQPDFVAVVWLLGIPGRGILFFCAICVPLLTEVREDWPGRKQFYFFLIGTLVITAVATCFDFCADLWDLAQ